MQEFQSKIDGLEKRRLEKDEALINQGDSLDKVYFLLSGKINVLKDDFKIASVTDKYSVFGEMSIFLNIPHSATIMCEEESEFAVVSNPSAWLEANPDVLLHITKVVCLRLFNLNQYLIDVKKQYEGHDHLGMVDDVLETLLNQQKSEIMKREKSKRDTYDY